MKYSHGIKYLCIVILSLCLSQSCQLKEDNSSYTNSSVNEWNSYLSVVTGQKENKFDNTILLILKSRECPPSIKELAWWNEYYQTSDEIKLKLIVLEKYETTYKTLLENYHIIMPAFQDSLALVLKKSLISTTPIKVYIGENGMVRKMAPIDAKNDEEEFLVF